MLSMVFVTVSNSPNLINQFFILSGLENFFLITIYIKIQFGLLNNFLYSFNGLFDNTKGCFDISKVIALKINLRRKIVL